MPETPTSSNIARWEYDSARRILKVTFRTGAVYEYEGVPSDVADDFESAPSAGTFLADEIKGKFRYRRVG